MVVLFGSIISCCTLSFCSGFQKVLKN